MTALQPQERIERLAMPEPNSGCWIWLSATVKNPCGMEYGNLKIGSRTDGTRRSISAHRYSFLTYKGAIPPNHHVCHKCDVPLCVNPDHLFVGTAKDNADDRDRKGRLVPAPKYWGEKHPASKYSDEQIEAARSSPLSSRAFAKLSGMSARYVRQLRSGQYRSFPKPPKTDGERA